MPNITIILKRSLLAGAALLLVGSTSLVPLTAFALDASTCTPPVVTAPGVHVPTGSDAVTYTYNCDTGLWENAYFTYNPANDKTTPKDPVTYTYNPITNKYDATIWSYDPAALDGAGAYEQVQVSVAKPPASGIVVGGPVAPAPAAAVPSSTVSGTGAGSTNTINNNGGTGGSITGTGADSTNTVGNSGTNTTDANNLNNATVNNTVAGQATTGNSGVIDNTSAGDATSGDAQDTANVVNMLQSSSNSLNGNTVTFVANINGDVNGDLLIDPSTLGTVQPASGNNDLTLNNSTNATINNDIDLNADSGDATVAGNTVAGNATSGSAEAIANVINLIDSAVSSGKSFIGTININGNLNGNIVVPPDFIDQLLASNVPTVNIDTTGADSTNTVNNTNSNTTNVTNTNNQGIDNNVNATATTGSANVSKNTSAGDATSGNAATHITAFNLTGSQVVGRNDMLVFVNVLGTWTGMILNAPAGATAAEFGSGITSTGDNSNNTVNNTDSNNTDINNTANEQINNNVGVNAQSGNANVKGNTEAGNATSGDADAAVNLANIEGSTLTLNGWFGILFINVFGTWTGSFGTSPSVVPTVASGGGTGSATGAVPQVFKFVPAGGGTGNGGSLFDFTPFGTTSHATSTNTTTTVPTISGSVLAAQKLKANNGAPTPQLQAAHGNLARTATIIGGCVVLYIVLDALYSRRHSRRLKV